MTDGLTHPLAMTDAGDAAYGSVPDEEEEDEDEDEDADESVTGSAVSISSSSDSVKSIMLDSPVLGESETMRCRHDEAEPSD